MSFSIDDKIYCVNDIDAILDDIKFCTITNNKRITYYNIPNAFDIETSSFYNLSGEKRACMYGWTLGINGKVILGRTWKDFVNIINKISLKLELSEYKRFVIYVHNLSYEFQWMCHYFDFENVFSMRERVPIYALTKNGIEFRCSYLLSGYNLENLGKNLHKYNIKKLVGDLDYKLIRTSITPLKDSEINYMLNDVKIVMCYVQEKMDEGDTIASIPLTKTGYVRRYCRNECFYGGYNRNNKNGKNIYYRYRELIKSLELDANEYSQLKRAFQGGFTHANPWKSGKVLNNVTSFDFKSSYPAVMCCEKYPMSTSEYFEEVNPDFLENNIRNYCCVFDIEIENLDESELYEHPLSLSKCWGVKGAFVDNGRLVSASHLFTTLTDVDYKIIKAFYDFKIIRIFNFRRYRKNYLPLNFVKSILKLYKDKTELDGIDAINYARSKTMINAAFGMIVTDICRPEIGFEDEWITKKTNLEESINKYNHSRNRFLFYPWGVWVTAYARRNLFSGIYEYKNDYIYSDTDSIKVQNAEKHEQYMQNYNLKLMEKMRIAMTYHKLDAQMTCPKNPKGSEKQLGIWENEGIYEKFKTLGAKRYMTLKNGKLSLTVSGVNKKIALPFLREKYDNDIDRIFEEFKDGLEIPPGECGKNTLTYIDFRTCGKVVDYLGNESEYEELSSIHMEEAGYSLSLSKEYADFLRGLETLEY